MNAARCGNTYYVNKFCAACAAEWRVAMKYVCPCGYEYDPAKGDPDNGIAPGTAWENVPDDFVCPVCGLGKDAFEKED